VLKTTSPETFFVAPKPVPLTKVPSAKTRTAPLSGEQTFPLNSEPFSNDLLNSFKNLLEEGFDGFYL